MQWSRFCLFVVVFVWVGAFWNWVNSVPRGKNSHRQTRWHIPFLQKSMAIFLQEDPTVDDQFLIQIHFFFPLKMKLKPNLSVPSPVVYWPHFFTPVNALKDVLHVANCAKVLFQPHLFPSLHSHWFFILQLWWEVETSGRCWQLNMKHMFLWK